MIIVYPVTAQTDYTELKYSLRSIEKFFKKPYEIIVVGDVLPEWITNIIQIKLPDIPGRAVLSVRRKILAALHYVNDEIFFMNDDFYLLNEVDKSFPYYTSGVLAGKGESGARPLLKQLESFGKPSKYYGHYPCIYKKDFIHVLENFTADCLTKSAYCNFIKAESVETSDCKLLIPRPSGWIKEFITHRPCFSTGMYSLKSALPVLQELYRYKSKFEA